MTKPVVLNLDDFCEDIMSKSRWNLLHRLKQIYPALKVTMFTIPLRCSLDWVRWVNQEYPWIEMHYHGSDHVDKKEWLERTDVDFPYQELFYRGFKAPWWKLGQKSAEALDKAGYLISAIQGYYEITARKVYRFNQGTQIRHNVWYENEHFHAVHSHVQTQKTKDGLPQIFDFIASAFPTDTTFLHISEIAHLL